MSTRKRTHRVTASPAVPTPYARRLASVTQSEYDTYHHYSESDTVLNRRIQQYCRDLGFDVPSASTIANDGYHWSATFVSWCVKQAGATSSEFKFSPAHFVFVHAAIANALAGTGVFRAWPINRYAPQRFLRHVKYAQLNHTHIHDPDSPLPATMAEALTPRTSVVTNNINEPPSYVGRFRVSN